VTVAVDLVAALEQAGREQRAGLCTAVEVEPYLRAAMASGELDAVKRGGEGALAA
jgi:hypothetical protein